MAMAGQGLNAAPPPRPASHNHFGGLNPGNQLYVGNVSLHQAICLLSRPDPILRSCLTKLVGKT